MDETPPIPTRIALPVFRLGDESAVPQVQRIVAEETPLAVEIDGEPYAVMMVTPGDLEDFAVGFVLSERLINGPGDIARIDVREGRVAQGARALAVDIRLEAPASERVAQRRRAMPGQSGCGLCGIMTLEEALPNLAAFSSCSSIAPSAIARALSALPQRQELNISTGATHAAAFCTQAGEIVALREDVGRHNAFDKIIGHLARTDTNPASGFALLTSRCSYELVQKAVLAGIPLLVTISAPTALAVQIARDAQLTLVALARADAMLVFNDPFGIFG